MNIVFVKCCEWALGFYVPHFETLWPRLLGTGAYIHVPKCFFTKTSSIFNEQYLFLLGINLGNILWARCKVM